MIAVNSKGDRNRALWVERKQGAKLLELGRKYGISKDRVRQIVAREDRLAKGRCGLDARASLLLINAVSDHAKKAGIRLRESLIVNLGTSYWREALSPYPGAIEDLQDYIRRAPGDLDEEQAREWLDSVALKVFLRARVQRQLESLWRRVRYAEEFDKRHAPLTHADFLASVEFGPNGEMYVRSSFTAEPS